MWVFSAIFWPKRVSHEILYSPHYFTSHRHGRQHTIMPTNVNNQANIWALKEEGCTHLLVTTACGSLREEIQPGDIVLLDQFIDR